MSRAARLGAFIIAAVVILMTGVIIIGGKQYLFTSTYKLNAQFDSVVGLAAGAEVRVGGVRSGAVSSVELPGTPAGKISVWMDLDSKTHDIIKQDSIATIETEGLLGNEYVAISFGSQGAPDVAGGGQIKSEPPLEMADLMKKAQGLLNSSQEALVNVTETTANLSSISGKIDDGQGTIGALVNDKSMYAHLDQTTIGMRDAVVKAQAGATGFQENMEAMKSNFLLRGFYKNRGYEDSTQLVKNEILRLPPGEPLKTFTYEPQVLFDKIDTAKPKNQKPLRAAGQFLADNEFGVAVIVVSTSMAGDTAKDLLLTQARASVVRDYLVDNFGFDDTELRTLGLGKQDGGSVGAGWGVVEIKIYPPGTDVPAKP